jgi:hypothetical protein
MKKKRRKNCCLEDRHTLDTVRHKTLLYLHLHFGI